MDSNKQLSPCPFCGYSGHLLEAIGWKDQRGVVLWSVECPHCLTCGPAAMSKSVAVQHWENRTNPLENELRAANDTIETLCHGILDMTDFQKNNG